MALWRRVNQSKLNYLSLQLRRYYVQTPHTFFSNHSVKNVSSCVLVSPVRDVCRRYTDKCYSVRFFATSNQGKVKKDEKASGGMLLNDEIKARFVRLVTDEEHFVVSLREARERAKELNLDLVQVQGNVDPPVCKMMDFKREQYKRKVKEKDRAKEKKEMTMKKGGCKEVRFMEKTELKDLKMKADSVVRLMERGYRVKCMAVGTPKKGGRAATSFKGSGGENLTEEEIAELRRQEEEEEKERLKEVLSRLTALLGDEYILESGPRAEKKQAYVIVRHAKFGPKKSGGGAKKIKNPEKVSSSNSGSIEDSEEEDLSDEDDENAWSVANSTDDFDSIFDVKSDAKEPCLNNAQNVHVQPEAKSSGTNSNTPNASQFRPVHDSKQQVRIGSSQQQSFEENRYKRSEPREQLAPTSPARFEAENRYKRSEPPREWVPPPPMNLRDNRTPDRMGSSRVSPPQFSNQTGKTGSGIDLSPATGERKPVQTDSSAFRPADSQKQPNLPNAPKTRPSYGIFSSPNTSFPGKIGGASEGNTENEEKSNYLDGNSKRPKDDGKQQPRWGIFSKDGPNVNPNRVSK